MLIVMQAQASAQEIEAVCERIRALGFTPHPIPGANRCAIGVTGNPGPIAAESFLDMAGVAQAIPVTKPYKLVLREIRDCDTVVEVATPAGSVAIGGQRLVIAAGPCAVEDRSMLLETAHAVKEAGASLLRGGAFKPRTSPYSFQGLGGEALAYLAEAREITGLAIVTEAVDVENFAAVESCADLIQIGARNMQNFSLLKRAGQARKPILLKRGISATVDEFLQAAEYILAEGNYQVVLCERGVRTFANHTRNTLDLSAIPVLQRLTHLPIVVDPSHATGSRTEVPAMSLAGIAAGADGLLLEVHPRPEAARSDGPQSLRPEAFAKLVRDVRRVAEAVGRSL